MPRSTIDTSTSWSPSSRRAAQADDQREHRDGGVPSAGTTPFVDVPAPTAAVRRAPCRRADVPLPGGHRREGWTNGFRQRETFAIHGPIAARALLKARRAPLFRVGRQPAGCRRTQHGAKRRESRTARLQSRDTSPESRRPHARSSALFGERRDGIKPRNAIDTAPTMGASVKVPTPVIGVSHGLCGSVTGQDQQCRADEEHRKTAEFER